MAGTEKAAVSPFLCTDFRNLDITQIVDALLNLPLEDQGYIDQRKAAKELRDSDNVTGKKLGSALLRVSAIPFHPVLSDYSNFMPARIRNKT